MKQNHKWAELSECEVSVMWLDCGNMIGLVAKRRDGERFAVKKTIASVAFEAAMDELQGQVSV